MKQRNVIGNSQEQVFQSWMASCLARTTLGFARAFHLLVFSLKGFIFITAGERSVTCGGKAMKPRNVIGNSQEQVFQSWMASCLARTKCVPCKDTLLFPHLLIIKRNEIRSKPKILF